MCHSDRTANEWYLRESLTEQAAEASVQIELHTKPSKEDPNANQSKVDPNAKTIKRRSRRKIVCFIKTKTRWRQVQREVCWGIPSRRHLAKERWLCNLSPSGSSSKHSLSAAQRKQIEKVFSSDIQSGIEPRRKRIVALMKSDPILQTLANSETNVRKVENRVRYIFDKRPTVDPFELPEESAANRTHNLLLAFLISRHQRSNPEESSGQMMRQRPSRRRWRFGKNCPPKSKSGKCFAKARCWEISLKQTPSRGSKIKWRMNIARCQSKMSLAVPELCHDVRCFHSIPG